MICLVTGGTSGIGEAIAIELAKKGHKVYASGRNIPEKSPESILSYVKMDVQDDLSVQNAIKIVLENEKTIDVLVNCAGLGIAGPAEETPMETIKYVFETNFFGLLRVTNAVLPIMRKAKTGYIINISSIASEMGLPFRSFYCASKAAVDMYTEGLRMELKPFNIKACVVQPGDFNTNISKNRSEVSENKSSAYHTTYEKVRRLVNEEVGHSGDPKDVGLVVCQIISDKNPIIKYKVGPFMQKIAPSIKKILPQTWFEKLVMNSYKL